ncbi:MAG: hypothetical protein FKY71_19215, partial [Spiribacter salinus]
MLKRISTMRARSRKWVTRKAATARVIMSGCREASQQFGTRPSQAWVRFLRLYARRFSPTEIFLWGLLDPALGAPELSQYVSKESLLRLQRRHNPQSYANLVEDKIVFHAQCAGVGLPSPPLLATFTRHGAWLTEDKRWVSVSEFIEYLNGCPETALVVKPANGVYGQGVQVIQRGDDERWIDDRGDVLTAEAVARYCAAWAAFDRFLVQVRIRNHPRIMDLTSVGTLQTVRVITVADRCGEPGAIVLANWRIAGAEGVVDNFDYGRGGNLIADIDTDSGEIRQVVWPKPKRQGIEEVHKHPSSGAPLKGAFLPYWQDVREIVV